MLTRRAAAPSTVKTPVDFEVPRGACDCHVHVFGDPGKFPFAAHRVYTPPEASVDDLRALQAALGFERVVIVTPSVYGLDNSCTLDAIRQLGKRAGENRCAQALAEAGNAIQRARRKLAEQRRAQESRASPEELLPGATGRIMMLEFSDLVFARHEFPDELYHRRLHKISPGHSP